MQPTNILSDLSIASFKSDHSEDYDEPIWIVPGVRVRIISQSYKKGRHYNQKVLGYF